jgi:hypothetical protein
MAMPSTVGVRHPVIGVAAEPQGHASRLRRVFRRSARRRRRALRSGWREEATLRAMIRV